MNIRENDVVRQSISLYRDQFLALNIVEILGDIEYHLENGRTFSALHTIRDLAAYISDHHAEEVAVIESMPEMPIFRIDSVLNAKRKLVLEKQAQKDDGSFHWAASGDFHLLDEDNRLIAKVFPNDCWISYTRGDGEIVGIGLTALIAHLSPDTLCEVSHRLSKWAARQEGGA